jgi:hypothetical protein
MARFMYNQSTRERLPYPTDPEPDDPQHEVLKERVQRMRARGFAVSDELVNTATGYTHIISCEASVSSGQGVARALATPRKDRTGVPAFMTVEQWAALPDAEKKKFLTSPTEKAASAKAAEVDAAKARIADLEKRLAQAEAAARGRRP